MKILVGKTAFDFELKFQVIDCWYVGE